VRRERSREELEVLRARGFRLLGEEDERLEDAGNMDRYSCAECGAWFASPSDSPDVMRDKRVTHWRENHGHERLSQ
jgi:hypothetical protein